MINIEFGKISSDWETSSRRLKHAQQHFYSKEWNDLSQTSLDNFSP